MPADVSTQEEWEVRYRQALENLEGTEALPKPPAGAERRVHPRLQFPKHTKVFVHHGPSSHTIRDISAGGISFFSERAYEVGAAVQLSAMETLAIEATVVGCEMEAVDDDMMEYRYRVRCRFAEDTIGYQIFVLGRELYSQFEGRSD